MNIPFISWLFKKKLEKISFTELEKRLLEEEKKRFTEFEKKAFSVFAQINYLLKKINFQTDALNKIDSEKSGRIGKIVSTSKRDFVFQVNSLASKIVPPKEHSFEAIKNYSVNSLSLLETELIKIRKLIALTAFGMTGEMKELGEYFKELVSAMNELKKALIESKLIELNNLKQQITLFHELEKNINEKKSEQKNNLKELKSVQNMLEEEQKKLDSVLLSSDAKQVVSLKKEIVFVEEQKKLLELKASALIGKADKPLKKLGKMIESNRFISKNYSSELLEKWLSSSVNAMKSDQKGETIKNACNDCIQLINSNEISSKTDKEKSKWIEALNEINSTDFFEEFFWKINSIESKKNSFLAEIEKNPSSSKITLWDKSILSLKEKLIELNSKKQKLVNSVIDSEKKLIVLKEKIRAGYKPVFRKEILLD
ncbi:MAG: hypothetical protein JW703_03380 [Candidatus Diapherotrites archaeon]|nr:hypothetical protein [Candidatus Diapherotrites archaeon]